MDTSNIKRHARHSWQERVRNLVWPRIGLRRYLSYLQKKILRLSASPHAVAAGFASGAAVSMTPFLGFHFFLGFLLAWIVRGNMLAAAIGTVVGNPFTFPLIFAASYQIGSRILGLFEALPSERFAERQGERLLSDGILSINIDQFLPVLRAMLVGAVPLAIVTFLVLYFSIKPLVTRFRLARQARLARRRAEREALRPDGEA
ncbi:DUF2062 domain-containing protein [Arsenicitalea aurantiaca]|uniref:DUF2062 domain-containing protein n=1 Tax=Arsenicitalea aurantiaca TaxID=1783274 RepID=A0A433X2N9_9HYPH|nr:DUF2062 domain-containing protein [Arsenicitalea aurantiaca]RUT28354.1 DUF2062 domain-containing protein [Arsenicitalea aurantiaca]